MVMELLNPYRTQPGQRFKAIKHLVHLPSMLSSARLALLIIGLPPPLGWASQEGVAHVGGNIGLSVMQFDYREFKDDGSQFNRENGVLPGILLGLTYSGNDWRVAGNLSHHQDNVGYEGQTQVGTSIRTSTNESLTDLAIEFSKQVSVSESQNFNLCGGIGYRLWKRDIQSTVSATGLFETYRWPYTYVGLQYPLWQETTWGNLTIDARLSHTYRPAIDIDFKGLYDSSQLDLGSKRGFRVALPFSIPQTDGYQLNIVPFWEAWEFGHSSSKNLAQNGIVVGTVKEPRSETKVYGIAVSLTTNF